MSQYATIEARELKRRLDNGDDLKVVETLPEDSFRQGHLPGAINIPTDKIDEEAPDKLRKDDTIVVYCANTKCSASPEAAKKLTGMGYENVLDFESGKEGWQQAGYSLTL